MTMKRMNYRGKWSARPLALFESTYKKEERSLRQKIGETTRERDVEKHRREATARIADY